VSEPTKYPHCPSKPDWKCYSTSPSVYVVWSTISAGINDWALGPPVTLAAHYNVTKAYPPNYLMTVPGACNYHQVGRPWSSLRVHDLMYPPQNWIADKGCFWQFNGPDGGNGPLGGVSPNGTVMAASPILSYPSDILTLDPAWKDCGTDAYNWGDYDPPRALTPASALVPTIRLAGPLAYSSIATCLNCRPIAHESVSAIATCLNCVPVAHKPFPGISPGLGATWSARPAAAHFHTPVETMVPPAITASQPVDPSPATHTEGGSTKPNPPSIDFGPLPGMPYVEATDRPSASSNRPSTSSDHPSTSSNHPSASSEQISIASAGSQPGMPYVKAPDHPSATSDPIAIATAGSRPVYVLPQGKVSVAGVIVSEGGPAVTIDTIRVSADAHAVYLGSSTFAKPTPIPGLESAPSVIGGQTMEIDRGGTIVIGGKTMLPGVHTMIDGTRISIGTDRIEAGSSTYAVPSTQGRWSAQPPSENALEAINSQIANKPPAIAGKGIGAGPNGAVVVGSLTISEGRQSTVDGTYVSVGSGYLVVGSSTYDKSTVTDSAAPDPASYRDVVVGGRTINLPVLPKSVLRGLASLESLPNPQVTAGFQTTISGTSLSVESNIIVIGKSTYALPSPTDPAISLAPNGAIMIDGKTLTPGLQTVISGTAVSAGSSIVVVGGKTYSLPLPIDPAISLAPNGAIVVDGKTLTPGMQTVISGTAVSAGSSIVVVGGKTYNLPLPSDSAVSRASNGDVVYEGITLSQGAQTTISGTAVSVGSNAIVVGGKTYSLPLPTNPAVPLASNGDIVFDGVTMTQGAQTTISGTAISVDSNAIVVGGKTYSIPLPTDSAVSLASNSDIVFNGVTMTQGAQTTISGTVVSVGSQVIVVGGKTYALPKPTKAPGAEASILGAIIASMHGYVPSTADSASPTSASSASSGSNGNSTVALTSFTGAAGRSAIDLWTLTIATISLFCVLI